MDDTHRLRIMYSIIDLVGVFSLAFSLFWGVQYWQATREIERVRADLRVADQFIALCLNGRLFVYGGKHGVGVKCRTM